MPGYGGHEVSDGDAPAVEQHQKIAGHGIGLDSMHGWMAGKPLLEMELQGRPASQPFDAKTGAPGHGDGERDHGSRGSPARGSNTSTSRGHQVRSPVCMDRWGKLITGRVLCAPRGPSQPSRDAASTDPSPMRTSAA